MVAAPGGMATMTGSVHTTKSAPVAEVSSAAVAPGAVDEVSDAAADRRRSDSSQDQAREEAALHGTADRVLDPLERLEARLTGYAADIQREQSAEHAAEVAQGPTKESGQGAERAFGRYASLVL